MSWRNFPLFHVNLHSDGSKGKFSQFICTRLVIGGFIVVLIKNCLLSIFDDFSGAKVNRIEIFAETQWKWEKCSQQLLATAAVIILVRSAGSCRANKHISSAYGMSEPNDGETFRREIKTPKRAVYLELVVIKFYYQLFMITIIFLRTVSEASGWVEQGKVSTSLFRWTRKYFVIFVNSKEFLPDFVFVFHHFFVLFC